MPGKYVFLNKLKMIHPALKIIVILLLCDYKTSKVIKLETVVLPAYLVNKHGRLSKEKHLPP